MGYKGSVPNGTETTQSATIISPKMQQLIVETADALQVSPATIATIISYETGGSMNPMQAGPTTQWGQHRGLIQFGQPQAQQYGVDFSNYDTALASQLGKDGAIVKYALGTGFKPGEHSGLQLYAAVNAGNPTALDASDAGNGGAPGTVEDKWFEQMQPHRAKFAGLNWREGLPDPEAAAKDAAALERKKRADGWAHFAQALEPQKQAPINPITNARTADVEMVDTGIPV